MNNNNLSLFYSMTDLNNVTNQLLNEYGLKFNENYNDIVQLNSTIQNKEELILKTQEVILYRERNIIILQYLLYYSISFLLLTILYAVKDINRNAYIGIAIFLFIVLAIACYFHVAKHFNYLYISSKLEGLKVAMKAYAKKLLENKIPPYECPTQCVTKDEGDDGDDSDSDYKYKNLGNTLKIDPSLNVWKYGDVPVGRELDFASSIDEEDNPQPFFGTSSPRNIYYECKWLGNKSGKNMPTNMRQSKNKYSSIPCNYRPNNTELSRWICQKDPNTLDANGKEQYCQKIN